MPPRYPESESSPHFYRFGDFELDLPEESLRRGDERLNINRRTFQVLRLLIERRGEIVTKEEFFQEVWGGVCVEDNNLTVTVAALRKILGDTAKNARFIENLPRRGYRFVAPVSVETRGRSAGDLSDPAKRPAIRAKRLGRLASGAIAVGLIVLFTIGVVGYKRFWPAAGAIVKTDSIAVLPFESRQPDDEYLADGLTDNIINGLSRLSDLRVIDRNSAYHYKNKISDLTVAGRELNVQMFVTGQVEQVDGMLMVTAELTDLAGHSRPWRQQFKGSRGETYAIQQEIVQAITQNVLSKAAMREQSYPQKRPTNNPDAYDLYLKGRYYWNKRSNQDLLRSVDLFRAAIDNDPTFAKAYVGLANAYALVDLSDLGIGNEERVMLSQGASQKALEIDDTIGEAYAVIGIKKVYLDWDFAGAESAYLRAIALDPNDATTHHWYAELLAIDGRFEESYSQYDIALSLDPLSLPIRTDIAFAHYAAHETDAAVDILNKAKELNPEYERTYVFLGYAYREKEMFSEFVDCLERILALQFQKGGRSKESYDVGMKYAADLRRSSNERGAKGFWQAELRSGPGGSIYKAIAYTKLGETDKAFELLETAFKEHQTGMVWQKVTPEFETLRSDPRYEALLHRIGFSAN